MAKKYNDNPLISERVKELLEKRNITQVYLAKEVLGIEPRSFSRILHDKYINEESLVLIAKELDCNPLYLTDSTCPYMAFATYETFRYDYDDCVKGLLHMQQYKPMDYSKEELNELKSLLGRQIDYYSAKHNKIPYDLAFWNGEGDKAGTANIYDKKMGERNVTPSS